MIERNNFKNFLETEVNELREIKAKLQQSLESAPTGALHVNKRQNQNSEFYLFENKKRKYLPQTERDLITRLAQKEYDTSALTIVDKRLLYGEKMLRQYNLSLDSVYEDLMDEKKSLIKTAVPDREEFIRKWYEANPGNQNSMPINTNIFSERGEEVRSKSEKFIADKLMKFDVPYVYEPKTLLVGNKIVYTDFKALNVRLLKTFAIEHFGMMGDPVYSESVCEKIALYESSGYMPGDNFLFTMESNNHALNTRLLEQLIIRYLK